MRVAIPDLLVCPSRQGLTFIAVSRDFLAEVVADDPRVLAVPAVVCPNVLLNAVCQGSLISCTLHVIHMDRPFALTEIGHCPCSSWTSANRAYFLIIKHFEALFYILLKFPSE